MRFDGKFSELTKEWNGYLTTPYVIHGRFKQPILYGEYDVKTVSGTY